MNFIDSRIIYMMVKNPRMSLRSMAMELNISSQDMNYRIKKIKEEGIIKKFMVHTNPAVYNMNSVYMAFQNSETYKGKVSSIIKCLEKITVYGFNGKPEELQEKKESMISEFGTPEMVYSPENKNIKIKITPVDIQIIEALKKNPLAKTKEIAEATGKKNAYVERRMKTLFDNKVVSIIPKLDLSKLNTVILGIFSSKIHEIDLKLEQNIIVVKDEISGIALSIQKDIYSAYKVIENIKKIDKAVEIMIVYDYDFFE